MNKFLTALLFSAAPLAAFASSCTDGEPVCVDGPGSKFINGVEVYRECWNWQRSRECREEESVNWCAALETVPHCTPVGTKCLSASLTGECLREERTFQCGDEVKSEEIDLVDFTHTLTETNNGTCSNFMDNPACYPAAERCLEGPETRIVNGLAVFKECWKKEIHWACSSDGVSNSCQTLVAAGCQPVGEPVCAKPNENGECSRWERTFRCVNAGEIAGPDISGNAPSNPGFDTLSCANATAGMTCTKQKTECIEPGGTKEIDGVSVTAPCWLQQETYRCVENNPEDSCGTVENAPGCEVETTKCVERNGPRCVAYEKTIRCRSKEPIHPPEPEISVEDQVTIQGPMVWESTCQPYQDNPLCSQGPKTCIQYSDANPSECLKWNESWLCQAEGGFSSDCASIEADKKCVLVAEDCIAVDAAGKCLTFAKTYQCEEREGSVSETTVCRPAECLDGLCDGSGDPADNEFASVVTWFETFRQGSVYGDLDGNRFFAGASDACSKKVLGFSCCDSKVQAGGSNSEAFGKTMMFAGQAAWEGIKYVGSPYVYDALSASSSTSGLLTALYGNAASGVYNPSLSFYGFGMTMQGGQMFFTFNPGVFAATVAFQIAMDYLQCSTDEQALMLKKGQRLCTYVGTYCSLDLGAGCVERKESYCCYNSRLARILNEQGRKQLGKTHGSAKHPVCDGFTMEELERLDFNQMDLSEFADEIRKDGSLNLDAASNRGETHLGNSASSNLGAYAPPKPGTSAVSNPNYSGNAPVTAPRGR